MKGIALAAWSLGCVVVGAAAMFGELRGVSILRSPEQRFFDTMGLKPYPCTEPDPQMEPDAFAASMMRPINRTITICATFAGTRTETQVRADLASIGGDQIAYSDTNDGFRYNVRGMDQQVVFMPGAGGLPDAWYVELWR